jgi:hypothetical protein
MVRRIGPATVRCWTIDREQCGRKDSSGLLADGDEICELLRFPRGDLSPDVKRLVPEGLHDPMVPAFALLRERRVGAVRRHRNHPQFWPEVEDFGRMRRLAEELIVCLG